MRILSTCMKCGCTDVKACVTPRGACTWCLLSIRTLTHGGKTFAPGELGVCSSCDEGGEIDGMADAGEVMDDLGDELFDDSDEEGHSIITPGDPRWHL